MNLAGEDKVVRRGGRKGQEAGVEGAKKWRSERKG